MRHELCIPTPRPQRSSALAPLPVSSLLTVSGLEAFICTDINRLALKATVATAERNQRPAPEVVLTSLLDGLDDRLSGQVDLLIFNPPYVETEEDESRQAQMASEALSSAWAGGHGGMSVTASLLAKVGRLLSPSGRLYLVAVTQNDPRAIVRAMQSEGLLAEVARCPIGGSQPA